MTDGQTESSVDLNGDGCFAAVKAFGAAAKGFGDATGVAGLNLPEVAQHLPWASR
jgi:hypothetical protein